MDYTYNIKNITRHLLVFIISAILLLGYSSAEAQQQNGHKVTGKVTSSADGTVLPGLTIVIKGTTQGVLTDSDGNYAIVAPGENSSLVFSYIGFKSEEIEINGRSTINAVLTPSTESIDEVVVTALGIKRTEKSLGFSVGRVGGEELTRVAQENILNSMAGKVSGVTINSTGGTGSSVSMVIRGATSLSSDNQPLFVVDGVPIANTVNNIGGFGNGNRVDYGNPISDINPEDIENVSILKGPSAAALYGTRAGNGVVLITTKKAKDNQGMKVSVTSNTVFDIPARFLDVQSQFSTGYFSFTPEDVGGGILPNINASDGTGAGPENDKGYWAVQWDAPLDANGVPVPTEVKSYPNNVRDFVNTGLTTTNGVAISNSTKSINYRLGYTNMSNSGIVPNSDLFKNSYTLSASSKVSEKFTVSTDINFNHTWSNNRPATNDGANPLQWAYSTPTNIDIHKLANYWVTGSEGLAIRTVSSNHENPYFLAYEVNNSFTRTRVYGNVMANWQISPELNVMARYALDRGDEIRETKMAPGFSDEPNNGTYGIATSTMFERNMDVLATYKKDIERFTLSFSAGGNVLYSKNTAFINAAKSGTGLIVPNVFTVQNISASSMSYSNWLYQRSINSIYALANLGWKEIVYLDLTARNDWASTLPPQNRSYFYPSASLSLMLNELLDLGTKVDMLKIRGGWAQVGNDTSPYSLTSVYENIGQWGDAIRLSKSGTLLTRHLKPEQATSLEFGLETRLFNNRLRFEGTYYTVDNRNQILGNVPLAVSSGDSRVKLNAGLLQSKGIELMLGFTPVKTSNWNWDLNLNFTKNQTTILELADGVNVIEFWDAAKSKSLGYAKGTVVTYSDGTTNVEDGLVGNIYSSQIARVTDKDSPYYGYPIINDDIEGEWMPTEDKVKVGNYNPKFIAGLQSQLRYKNFTLSMTFDWRCGGQYISQTYRYFTENVMTQTWLDNLANPNGLPIGEELRNWVVQNADKLLFSEDFHAVGGPTKAYGGFPESYSGTTVYDGTFSPGVVGSYDANGNFILNHENLGNEGTIVFPYIASNPWNFGSVSMFDADYIKMREISFNYQLPKKLANKFGAQDINFAIYSRNIMIWTKDSGFGIDPERAFQAESSSGNRGTQFMQGIERYNVDPWAIPVGFKIGLTF
ncbi:MAG: SusC/RagA family TonB-linked outer membrane protein [Prolixibacteraceae bacterium]|jgi:TonB-linked SusC/RagA family outer membrane protein